MSKCARGMKGAFHNECGYSGCLEHGATEALAASGRIRVTALTTPAIKDEKKKKTSLQRLLEHLAIYTTIHLAGQPHQPKLV